MAALIAYSMGCAWNLAWQTKTYPIRNPIPNPINPYSNHANTIPPTQIPILIPAGPEFRAGGWAGF